MKNAMKWRKRLAIYLMVASATLQLAGSAWSGFIIVSWFSGRGVMELIGGLLLTIILVVNSHATALVIDRLLTPFEDDDDDEWVEAREPLPPLKDLKR